MRLKTLYIHVIFIVITNLYSANTLAIPEPSSNSLKQNEQSITETKRFGINNKPKLTKHQKPAVIFSTEEQIWIKQHPIISVGGSPDWTPFNFVDSNGQYSGIANDYLSLVAKYTGLKFDVAIEQWSKNLQSIRDQQIDLLPAVYFTEERTHYLTYSTPYFDVLDYFFIRDDLDVKTLKDLNGKRVAIPKDYAHLELIRKHFPKIKVVIVDTFGGAIDAVLEKRADMLYDTYAALIYTFEKEGINTIIPFKSTREIGKNPIHIATRKDAPELSSIIQKGLNAIPEKEKRNIYNKWLGENSAIDNQTIHLSSTEQQWLNKHITIRFAGDPNWLPYEAFDAKGNYIGIVAEHLKIIEQKLGIKIDIIPTLSWNESIDKVRKGEIDVLSETNDSNLKSHLDFTQSYIESPIVIVMRNDQDYVENIRQIKHRKIAIIKDYGYVPKIITKYNDIYFQRVKTIQDGLTAVSTGKIDALLATLAQASFHISELSINNIRIVGKTEFKTQLAFGIRKELSPMIPLFDRALDSINQADKQRILNQWGKPKFTEKIDYQLLGQIAGILLFIIVVFIYWNRKLRREVSLRKKVEAQTQALIDKIPLPIIVTTHEGHILSANPQTLSDFKIGKEDVDQFNVLIFYKNKNDRDLITKEIAERGRVEQKIIPFKRLDGTCRSMMLSVMPITYADQNAFLTIAVDMTEHLEAEELLKKTKESAEAANQAKSAFLANMSHEIRTPMNAIIGFTELLNEQITDTRHKSYVKTIQAAGNNLLVLINDILDLSKIEAGKLQIEKKPCNPHDLFTEVGNIFMLKMMERNINFILEIDSGIPQQLLLDATRLRQVLLNLIGNAVKFTSDGTIRIQACINMHEKAQNTVDFIIDIEDTGIGISDDQQKLIFEEFKQSKGLDVRKFGGTGLGLSICKRLVNMMGGKIVLKSTLGQGSTFTIKLFDVEIISLIAENKLTEFKINSEIKFYNCNILIVDDIEDNRSLLKANFANTLLQIDEAENGLQALNLVKQKKFDLILMDIRMPGMDGYQAAKEIKMLTNIPIIALTASVMTNELEHSNNINFDGYLRKPVLKAELFSELSRFLRFDEVTSSNINSHPISLTRNELMNIPFVLNGLLELTEHCDLVSKNNNISEIKKFTDTVFTIIQQHPISLVEDYATQLQSNIDCFDIAAIKRSLNDFQGILTQLELADSTK